MIKTDISFTIIGVPTSESTLDSLWNTLEDTGTITKQEFFGTNLTNCTTLVNCDFLWIKTETAEEKYGARN
jgi:hypothetical protein